MTDIRDLKKSLDKARADLTRARAAYSTCLLTGDNAGCADEQDALAAAERRVHALERRLRLAEIEGERRTA